MFLSSMVPLIVSPQGSRRTKGFLLPTWSLTSPISALYDNQHTWMGVMQGYSRALGAVGAAFGDIKDVCVGSFRVCDKVCRALREQQLF